MFDKSLLETDDFMDMPVSTKALYFLLGMEADDEGFVSPKRVMRLYGGTEDDLKVLTAKKFIITFKSGVIVITDWNENNYLDKNRIKKTKYKAEKALLALSSNKYTLLNECLTDVQPEEYRVEENRRESQNQNFAPPSFFSGKPRTEKGWRDLRRAELGKPPTRTPRTKKQDEVFAALTWKDYFREQGYEIHGMQFFRVHNEKREKVISKLIISAYEAVDSKIGELIDWWFEGAGEWAQYEPEQCFSSKTLEKFLNKGKGKKEDSANSILDKWNVPDSMRTKI